MVRLLSKKLHKHFWNEESGLTSMFILLCISNFIVVPFFSRENVVLYLLVRLFWFGLLIAGITSLSESRKQMRKFSLIPVLLLIVSILKLIFSSEYLDYFEFMVMLAVFALLIGMVLVKVFENGSITIHRVIGSILAYMLIGNVWAQMFQFLYIHVPGSLQIPETLSSSGVPHSVFIYFSYTTLTTTGYGEILPVHAIARTLVIIEQLIGVLYPVVLIGRLVSLVTGSKGSE
jgi:membrane-associated HD superfamily phosphohydrolase